MSKYDTISNARQCFYAFQYTYFMLIEAIFRYISFICRLIENASNELINRLSHLLVKLPFDLDKNKKENETRHHILYAPYSNYVCAEK